MHIYMLRLINSVCVSVSRSDDVKDALACTVCLEIFGKSGSTELTAANTKPNFFSERRVTDTIISSQPQSCHPWRGKSSSGAGRNSVRLRAPFQYSDPRNIECARGAAQIIATVRARNADLCDPWCACGDSALRS